MARPANGKYCYVHVANLQVAFNRFGKQTDCMVDEDFVWPLAQELVKIDSSDPGAYKGEIEQHIKDLVETYVAKLDSPVLDTAEIRELEVFPGRCNLMITVPGASDEARLVYICHMDTVPWAMAGTRTRPSASLPATPTPPSLPARKVTTIV